jgi:hypothetical protein
MLRGHNAVIHTTPKWARQRIKRKKDVEKWELLHTRSGNFQVRREIERNGQFATRGCIELRT